MTHVVQEAEEKIEQLLEKIDIVPKTFAQHSKDAKKLSLADTEVFPFSWQGMVRIAVVLDVVDGDSVKVGYIDHNVETVYGDGKHRCVETIVRLYGVDCAEMRPRLLDPNREKIIAMAKRAKEFTESMLTCECLGRECFVLLYFLKHEKYGRPMAIVVPLDDANSCELRCKTMLEAWQISLNRSLIENGLALPYQGKSRWTFRDMERHYDAHQNGSRSLPSNRDISSHTEAESMLKRVFKKWLHCRR